jgi:hypothetical protein
MRRSLARGLALMVCQLAVAIALAQAPAHAQGISPLGPAIPPGRTSQPAAQPPTQPPGQAPSPTSGARHSSPLYITAQTDVVVPFTINTVDAKGGPPAKVRVYVSLDQGRNWDLYQEVRPEEKGFRFRPRRDAEFWFSTETVAADGTTERVEQRVPQMRLIIDTEKPRFQLIPKLGDGGKLQLAWSATDPYLDNRSVKVEWQDSATGQWHRVTPVASPTDSAPNQRGLVSAQSLVSLPAGTTAIVLRAEAADTAGNKTYLSKQFDLQPATEGGELAVVPTGPGSGALAQRWTPDQNDPYTRQPNGAGSATPRMQPNTALVDVRPGNSLPPPRVHSSPPDEDPFERSPQLVRNPYSAVSSIPARNTNTGELLPPADRGPNSSGNGGSSTEALPAPQEATAPTFNAPENQFRPTPEAIPRDSMPAGNGPQESLPQQSFDRESFPRETIRAQPVQPESIESEPVAPPRRVEPVSPPLGNRPRMTNHKRFSLDYDIETVGPEGVADVELWGTADQGQTWIKWGSDPDRASPFEVEVSNEATYGFRIVIVGRNGLTSNSPQPGDSADIWVGIDQAKPHARLTGATIAGGEQAGKLEIRWEARDEHFGPRPITLAVSERASGPFTPIAAGLPNSGAYYWEFDPRVRRQLFLRLEAQDEAGNLTVDQLTDPISIEGLAPRGRIRDIAPAQEPPPAAVPQAFRSPLFR